MISMVNIFLQYLQRNQLLKIKKHGVHESEIEHVLNGGGRKKYEDQWYYLREELCE